MTNTPDINVESADNVNVTPSADGAPAGAPTTETPETPPTADPVSGEPQGGSE